MASHSLTYGVVLSPPTNAHSSHCPDHHACCYHSPDPLTSSTTDDAKKSVCSHPDDCFSHHRHRHRHRHHHDGDCRSLNDHAMTSHVDGRTASENETGSAKNDLDSRCLEHASPLELHIHTGREVLGNAVGSASGVGMWVSDNSWDALRGMQLR